MQFWLYLFIISCTAVFYNYAGYAIIVYLINRLRKKKASFDPTFYPTVSFIVAAYNEEDCIEKKILNSLKQDYPRDRIEFIFITDGSTDRSMDIIRRFSDIRLEHEDQRRGKTAALNRVVSEARNEILIFSDANTFLNEEATRNITRHYRNPNVGGVAGEKKVIALNNNEDEVGAGEGLYWKYESALKKIDSDFHSVVGAAGELFSLRRDLYEHVSDTVILDDFIISMGVVLKGYSVRYEPDAYAMELPSFSIKDEQKRKVRIAAGGFQALVMLKRAFYFWKYPRVSFLYVSHRVLRWTLSPLCLVLALISNGFLLFSNMVFFKVSFAAQALFYVMAFLGSRQPANAKGPKPFRLAYYFVFMNLSVIMGFVRFLKGKQSSAWEKARRNQQPVLSESHPK